MIQEINLSNINKLDNSFVDKNYIQKELNNNPFARIIILEENNEIIGYLYYSEIYDRYEINQIEIEINHRNCGKADYLLKKFTENVDKSITLEVRIDNIPAIKLYENNGFEKKATRQGYYNGIDGILMERK